MMIERGKMIMLKLKIMVSMMKMRIMSTENMTEGRKREQLAMISYCGGASWLNCSESLR